MINKLVYFEEGLKILRNESATTEEKKLISYLFECCFYIIFSKKHSASESPGCEQL